MIHDDMTLARFMVHAQSIEESKFNKITRNLRKSGFSDQINKVQKEGQTQEELRSANVKFEGGGGSQNEQPTCATW